MPRSDYATLAAELIDLLKLQSPPLAITFSQKAPAGVAGYDVAMPAATPDGRTGRVPAGCVFWMKAAERTFTTVAEDHGNCSVGSYTHGLKTLAEAATKADVKALLDSGWVTMDMVPSIPFIKQKPAFITYGPLAQTPTDPDVVFLRLNGRQVMILRDAIRELVFEGKPQCHIIPMAKENGQVAVSVGCMLSRVRTGMPVSDVTCAIPGRRLAEVMERLRTTCTVDNVVAAYAAEDARRFRA